MALPNMTGAPQSPTQAPALGYAVRDGRMVPVQLPAVPDPLTSMLRSDAKDENAVEGARASFSAVTKHAGVSWRGRGYKKQEAEDIRNLLRKVDFPTHPPAGWPGIISWPTPQIIEALKRVQNDQAALIELNQKLTEQAREYAERGKIMDEFINSQKTSRNVRPKQLGFAMLHDELANIQIMNDVTSYDHNLLRFKDGSSLRVKNPHGAHPTLQITGFNEKTGSGKMAIRAALIEARTRGWPSMKFSGSRAFLDAVAAEAKNLNYPVELKYPMDRMSWNRVRHVHQTPPLSDKGKNHIEEQTRRENLEKASLESAIQATREPAASGKPNAQPIAPKNDIFDTTPEPRQQTQGPV